MVRVIATDASKRLNVRVKELRRIAMPGEIFEVTEDRFKVLNGGNRYRSVFAIRTEQRPEPLVEKKPEAVEVEFIKEPELVKEEVKEEKPKKKATTKKTTTKKTTKKKVKENE